jgi:CubicO group peptidase (beta-lactamase class C family)
VSVGVVRDGELVWSQHVGAARLDPARPADDDTQFMIGSVTKTFTALLVMQLRDAGRLGLDDPVGTWLPDTKHADVTVRQLLAHSSGLQREPVGHVWETLEAPDSAAFLEGLEQAERVLPPHFVFHYSNLAYGLLGQLVERLHGGSWEACVMERVLGPLGMTRTGLRPADDRAIGYQIDPFAGTATQEPVLELKATAPLGGLWSTVADMARYAAFIADPDPDVLLAASLEEMCRPLVMVDPDGWTLAYGMGFGMARRGQRVYVGHGGAMPGFLTGLRVRRADRVGVIAFANTTAGAKPVDLAADVLDAVLDEEPTLPQAWVPEERHPDLVELLGSWWSEGEELVLEVRGGELWMRVPSGTVTDETRLRRESQTTFRAVEGRERGEVLELVRAEDGSLEKLYFATYAVTRRPMPFAQLT